MSFNIFSQKGKTIECDAFYKLVTSDNYGIIFDLRVLEKYKKGRIENASWAGTKESFKPLLEGLERKSPIFIYCEKGKRSKECSKWLNTLGFKNVYELKGGMIEWVKNGYLVDNSVLKEKKVNE